MPGFPIGDIAGQLGSALEAVVKPAVPELEERLTQTLPHGAPFGERAPDVPFAGPAALRPVFRATDKPEPVTLADGVQKLKDIAGSFVEATPNVGKDVKAHFFNARVADEKAGNMANLLIRKRIGSLLRTAPREQATLLSDYMVATDEMAQITRDYAKKPDEDHYGVGGTTIDQIESVLKPVAAKVAEDPDVQQAAQAYRSMYDEMFKDKVRRGWITPSRKLTDYTPRDRLSEIVRADKEWGGEVAAGPYLSELQHRSIVNEIRETNAIKLLHKALTNHMKRAAADELLFNILKDPTLNRTGEFQDRIGERVPKGWKIYMPQPAGPGWALTDAEGNAMAGAIKQVSKGDRRVMVPGGFVLPDRIVDHLESWHTPRPNEGVSGWAYHAGNMYAGLLTVLNTANTALNAVADPATAVLGLPGEKADPVGFVTFYPRALGAMVKSVSGHPNELADRAIEEGLTSSTMAHVTDNDPLPVDMVDLMAERRKQGLAKIPETLRNIRQVVEATPRIAAGLAAEAKTGDPGAFGEVGRKITLAYGVGAPAASRQPVVRLLAPFIQFLGLATQRSAQLLTTKGSRARAWGVVLGVPLATMGWNYQNEEYTKVELGLRGYEQRQLHAIVPDPSDPSKPYRDRTGNPVVWRIRWDMPEEVLHTIGLGNYASRVRKMALGYKGIGDELSDTADEARGNLVGQIAGLGEVISFGTGRSLLTGEQQSPAEFATTALPQARAVAEGIKEGRNAGPVAGLQRFAEVAGGISLAHPVKQGRADADLMEISEQRDELQKRVRAAQRKQDFAKARDLQQEVQRLNRRVGAIQAARRKAKVSG